MIYAIISDIHSNLNALEAVLDFIKDAKVDKIINCGDIVGYGTEPNECIETLKKMNNILSIAGNHDWATIHNDIEDFNPAAMKAIIWTQKELYTENISYINLLETMKEQENFMFVHGSPRIPLFEYILGVSQASPNFYQMEKDICFIGHTHIPACFKYNNGEVEAVPFYPEEPLDLSVEGTRYIINVGSVGQPRDGDPRASVCIYDTKNLLLSLYRVKYDIISTQRKILKAGLPGFLAFRLEHGI